MRLELENRPPLERPTAARIKRALLTLRSYRSPSFAALVADNGSFIQVAGGGGVCAIERRDAGTGRILRALTLPNPAAAGDTQLSFGGGTIILKRDEWFTINHAIAAFKRFADGDPQAGLTWRDMTERLG